MAQGFFSILHGNKLFPHLSVQDLSEEEGRGLSPGLSYLEQVCQTLEEFARQQMRSQALQREMDALQERGDMEVNKVALAFM